MSSEKESIDRKLTYTDLGIVDYKDAWDMQHQLLEKRSLNEITDTLLLLEHPHTYTLGKVADKANLLLSKADLEKKKISLYDIDRGGDITYHGPGQVVGYSIINLKNWEMDTHKYLRALEEVVIKTVAEFGIESARNKDHTGVWVGDNKICAIGIKVSRWITMHGFALNVNTDLNLFNGIVPCGIESKGVTSLQKELNDSIDIDRVKSSLVGNFQKIFNYESVETKKEVF